MRLIDADELMKSFKYTEADTLDERMMNLAVRRIIKEQPTINQWIPVSERLPEVGAMVLTCSRGGYMDIVEYREYAVLWSSIGAKRIGAEHLEVIAWQPLPAPYERGDD